MFPNLGSLLGAVDADKTPWLIWMGLGGSLYAFYWTFRASRDSFITMRTRYAAVATLAAMFVIAYLVLIFVPVDESAWVDFTRGMGFVCWFMVWAEPARHLVSFSKKLDRCIEDYLAQEEADRKAEERQRKLLKSQSRNLPEGTDLHPSDDLLSREVEKDDNE